MSTTTPEGSDNTDPETPPEITPEITQESPPATQPDGQPQGLWSRVRHSAQTIASAAKGAASRAAHVTAEVARETIQVTRDGTQETASLAHHTVTNAREVGAQAGAAFAKVGKTVTDTGVGIAQSAGKTIANASAEAVKVLVNNMNEALPFIERAGYAVSEIELGLTVPPKIVMHLTLAEELSDEARAALMKDCEGRWFTRQLIERLHDVRQVQRATQFVGMAFDEIEIEIGLIPSVLLHYRKVHRAIPLPALTPHTDAVTAREVTEGTVGASSQPRPIVEELGNGSKIA